MEWQVLTHVFGFLNDASSGLIGFTFYYPLFMSYLWIVGGIHYYLRFERDAGPRTPPPLKSHPPVSILIPMRNEAGHARETVEHLAKQRYPNLEIVVVDDGSTDDTGHILDELMLDYPDLRVLHMSQNQGKAVALNMAAMCARHEYLVCIDGDALLDEDAVAWFMWHFASGPRVGGVTGNPRVRNRSTVLGKIQVGEFSSIVGLIKRAQRVYGRIFTVSGVVCAFRRRALHDVGFWSPEMLTEDIDVSWKLQLAHWDIRFEPRALCWILMPETLRGLWRQRLRWAMGGIQVIHRDFGAVLHWKSRRMWPVFGECVISVIWGHAIAAIFLLWLIGRFVQMPHPLAVQSVIPGWTGVLIGVTCLFQSAVALFLDRRYDRNLARIFYWMIWYPLVYWLINMLTTVCAVPAVILRRRTERAVWVSPDRGLSG